MLKAIRMWMLSVDDIVLGLKCGIELDYRKGESAYSDTYPDRIWERESR